MNKGLQKWMILTFIFILFQAVIDTLVGVNGVHLHIFDEAGVTVADKVDIIIGPLDNSTVNKDNSDFLSTSR